MTAIQIKEQVKAIRKATKDAAKSKESALQFLKEAGIVRQTSNKHKGKK